MKIQNTSWQRASNDPRLVTVLVVAVLMVLGLAASPSQAREARPEAIGTGAADQSVASDRTAASNCTGSRYISSTNRWTLAGLKCRFKNAYFGPSDNTYGGRATFTTMSCTSGAAACGACAGTSTGRGCSYKGAFDVSNPGTGVARRDPDGTDGGKIAPNAAGPCSPFTMSCWSWSSLLDFENGDDGDGIFDIIGKCGSGSLKTTIAIVPAQGTLRIIAYFEAAAKAATKVNAYGTVVSAFYGCIFAFVPDLP